MKKIILILIFLFCINVNASIVVMDADSGRILYSKNKNERKLIASTTKIMTTLIALENAKLTDKLKVGNEIRTVDGSMIYVKENEIFTLNDLLHGLILQSENDAAITIASKIMPYNNFIAKMNLKAHKLGMNNTTFENPHGLNDDTKDYSTAEDMSKLMRYAIKNKDFIKITSTKKYKVKNYIWYNKNKLLSEYKYLISGKIGYTKASGQVFVSAAKKGNKTLIISSIDESDKFNLHKNLYEKYFKNYERYKVLDKNTFSFKVKNKNHDHYYIKNDFDMLLTKEELKKIKIKANLSKNKNYVNIYLDENLIHSEKLYILKYQSRLKKLKDLLLFFK